MSMIRKLDGANMDIDLTSGDQNLGWNQDSCPWNVKDKTNKHRCAVKGTSICGYLGVNTPDICENGSFEKSQIRRDLHAVQKFNAIAIL